MKTVFESNQVIFLHHIKNILENHGIACVVSGDIDAGNISGSITQAGRVSVLLEEDAERAEVVIAKSFKGSEEDSGDPWVCSRCKEKLGPQFDECWKCSKARDW